MFVRIIICPLLACFILSGCVEKQSPGVKGKNTAGLPVAGAYDTMIDGQPVRLYVLKNANNAIVAFTNLGARIVSLIVPDRNGNAADVVLGFDSVLSYLKKDKRYFGATVGRYANRIAKGKFQLDGSTYQLDINSGSNSLHGGSSGLYSKVWTVTKATDQQISFNYKSADGEGGYPGNVEVSVTYTLLDNNSLEIGYSATTDRNTIINMTNHSFFNLNGAGTSNIYDHILSINASRITPIDTTSIPTGNIQDVANTPFDFRKPTTIGKRLQSLDPQLLIAGGYDHNFVLDDKNKQVFAAMVKAPKTGIIMKVYTDQPGLQFYDGHKLNATDRDGKGGATYGPAAGFCLETQHFPNSPNQPGFPSTVLKAGETFTSKTVYAFEFE